MMKKRCFPEKTVLFPKNSSKLFSKNTCPFEDELLLPENGRFLWNYFLLEMMERQKKEGLPTHRAGSLFFDKKDFFLKKHSFCRKEQKTGSGVPDF